MTKLTAEDANLYLAKTFDTPPHWEPPVHTMEDGRAVLRNVCSHLDMRPGGEKGFISGPTQMRVADMAAFFALQTKIGLAPMAMTANLNINFLRPCAGNVLMADARVMKLGKSLAVMEVSLYAEGAEDRVSSHAVATFGLPRD